MDKIAVFGSRKWPRPSEVADVVRELHAERGKFILVSGNAVGASRVAEDTAREIGLPVLSFQPVRLQPTKDGEEQYAVREWRMKDGSRVAVNHYDITWADWVSALAYRSILMVERVSEGIAFWDGYSAGTKFELGLFEAYEKPVAVIRQ